MRFPDRDTLTYALEVFLPLDVDRLVCDFIRDQEKVMAFDIAKKR